MREEDGRAVEMAGPRAELGPVEQEVRLLVLDSIACAVAGLRHREVASLVATGETGSATFPGLGTWLTPMDLARVFTVACCWDEFCAGHVGARGRPGLHSVGPAVASAGDADLGTVLRATLAGYDTGARYGCAWTTEEGLHVDGSWGVSAAAAAAAAIAGLATSQAVESVRIAASMPGTALLSAARSGATSRNLYAAEAVVRGMSAARAAEAGFTGPPDAILGAARLLGRPTVVESDPGPPIRDGYLKIWPGVRHTHYAVAAALEWRARNGVPSGPVVLDMHPGALEYTGVRRPRTLLQRQFSATWSAAYALIHGRFDLEAFESGDDAEVERVEAAITLTSHDHEWAIDAARWGAITGADGEVLVTAVPGDRAVPIPVDDVLDKARMLMRNRLGGRTDAVVDFLVTAPLETPWRDCLPE